MDKSLFNFKRITLEEYDSFLHCFYIDSISESPNMKERVPVVSDFMGFIICQCGELEVEINNELYRLESGNLITIFPSTIMKPVSVSEDFSGIGIAVSKHYLSELGSSTLQSMLLEVLHIQENPAVSINDEQLRTLVELYDLIRAKYARESHPFKNEITGVLFISFVFEVFAIYTQNKSQFSEQKANSRYDDIFKKFMLLLSQHSGRERSVVFYAQQLCICPKYLTTIIKSVSGRGVHAWIELAVTGNAKTLLKNTTLTIQEIADKLNFPTATFFGQYFKRVVGMTPKEYRKKI